MYIITDKQILKTFLNLTLLYKIFENYTWIVLQLMQRKMYNKLNIFIEKIKLTWYKIIEGYVEKVELKQIRLPRIDYLTCLTSREMIFTGELQWKKLQNGWDSNKGLLVKHLTNKWEAQIWILLRPEFFRPLFCNWFNCSLPVKVISLHCISSAVGKMFISLLMFSHLKDIYFIIMHIFGRRKRYELKLQTHQVLSCCYQ